MTIKKLAEKIGCNRSTIQEFIKKNNYKESNPKWFKKYKTEEKHIAEYLSPELVEIIEENLSIETAPENWMAIKKLAEEIGYADTTISNFIKENNYKESNPKWFKMYKTKEKQNAEHLSLELVEIIRENLSIETAPENWMAIKKLAEKIGCNRSAIQKFIKPYKESNPKWFKKYRTEEKHIAEYLSPELVKIIRENLYKKRKTKEFKNKINFYGQDI